MSRYHAHRPWAAWCDADEGRSDGTELMAGADYRVSDAERDAAIEQLQRHTAEGRLSVAEFGERLEEALHARTWNDLSTALRGLPGLHVPRRSATPRVPAWALLLPLLLVLAFAAFA